jgi:hypothetical protein
MTPTVGTSEAQFDPIYWASKSPEILMMMAEIKAVPVVVDGIANPECISQRAAIADNTAKNLIAQGRTGPADLVDNPIMVWGWSPFVVMSQLIAQGEPRVMDITNTYPIKPSILLSDYPTYQAPATVKA